MPESRVVVEGTPNPNAAKFVVAKGRLGERSRSYFSADEAQEDPLAASLFAIDGVRALLIVDNFITVTKEEAATWDDLVEAITRVIDKALEE